MNIIPITPGTTPSYYCTWGAQNGLYALEAIRNPEKYQGGDGAKIARNNMDDEHVFGENGMARQYDKIRSDLYFILDDGWDVPYNINPDTHRFEFGSLLLNEERFPSCAGKPEVRLQKMNEQLKALGWRGVGIWIASQAQGETKNNVLNHEQAERYWKERIAWSRDAGIEYWKVDWGLHEVSVDFRRMLTTLGKQEYPGLLIEQARCMGCINENNGRFDNWDSVTAQSLEIFSFSDVFRSYDVSRQLSAVSTLERLSVLLLGHVSENALGLINCEDELYMGAALGCTLGIMRTGLNQRREKLLDEAVRAVRWQRIAPAFGADVGKTYISEEIVEDSWFFKPGDIWDKSLLNREVKQKAPLVVSRGIELPRISGNNKHPFVVAAKNPNGAVSIATLPRTTVDRMETPLCQIELNVGEAVHPVGVFGYYDKLVLNFSQTIESKKIYAQDLAGDSAREITNAVSVSGNQLIIKGELITEIGLSEASKDDGSGPGLAIVVI